MRSTAVEGGASRPQRPKQLNRGGSSYLTADLPASLIEAITAEVMRRNGRWRGREILFSCPNSEKHANGDVDPSATWNPERQVWYCHSACKDGDGALDLARRLGIDVEHYLGLTKMPRDQDRQSTSPFDAFCRTRHLSQARLISVFAVRQTTYGGRPALVFPTDQGHRIKFLDGMKPKAKWMETGATATIYNADRALDLLHAGQDVLYQTNGEPSVWACDQEGVAAFTTCTGEGVPSPDLVERLKNALATVAHPVTIAVAFDRDGVGIEKGLKAAEAYQAAGIPSTTLRLPDNFWQGGERDA